MCDGWRVDKISYCPLLYSFLVRHQIHMYDTYNNVWVVTTVRITNEFLFMSICHILCMWFCLEAFHHQYMCLGQKNSSNHQFVIIDLWGVLAWLQSLRLCWCKHVNNRSGIQNKLSLLRNSKLSEVWFLGGLMWSTPWTLHWLESTRIRSGFNTIWWWWSRICHYICIKE